MEPYAVRSNLALKQKNPAVRWVREWVPQDVVATGGKCYLLKWVTEDMLNAVREKSREIELEEQRSEPATEMLFLCTYEGCGKTFDQAAALRKHTHVHGERQYVCPVEGCGKKFLDSSKLKRHNLIHTGEKNNKCPYEGCGKAFSLDFNLRAHMKTHSLENYHVCTYPECGKRYTHEFKLKSHIKTHHEKKAMMDMMPPPEKLHSAPKASAFTSTLSDRPYVCPHPGCGKAYIHEYKLNLHLRKEHPAFNPEESYKPAVLIERGLEERIDQDTQIEKAVAKNSKRAKPKSNNSRKVLPDKVARTVSIPAPIVAHDAQKWPSMEAFDEDSEETEENQEDVEENGWRFFDLNRDEDETEDRNTKKG